jgi:hypothetical protein
MRVYVLIYILSVFYIQFNEDLTRENYLVLFIELDEMDSLKIYHFFNFVINRGSYFLEEISDT